jgi:hypothetical protein
MYGPSHWAVIAVFAIGSVLVVCQGRTRRVASLRRHFSVALGRSEIYSLAVSSACAAYGIDWLNNLHSQDGHL